MVRLPVAGKLFLAVLSDSMLKTFRAINKMRLDLFLHDFIAPYKNAFFLYIFVCLLTLLELYELYNISYKTVIPFSR